jgi:DNA-binding CsgD family transcriptional regulator
VDRAELMAQEAWIAVHSGHPARARKVIAALPAVAAPRVTAVRALAESYVLSLTGFPDAALALAQQGHAIHLELGDRLWVDGPAGHVIARVLALTEAGRLTEAAELAAVGYRDAATGHAPFLQVRFAYHCGRISLLRGQVRTAQRWFTEALARGEASGFRGARDLVVSGLAVAASLLGEATAAEEAVQALDAPGGTGFLPAERELGRAWRAVAAGNPAAACRILTVAAQDGVDSGHVSSAAWLLHDAARLGQAPAVVGQLETLAAECDSELVGLRAAHARALVDSDHEALGQVADRWEAAGALLVAAEAAAAAGEAAGRNGLGRRSTALATRAAALAGRCEGARTPGILGSDGAAGLTPREREVAAMAAAGVASKDIAERLFLSIRTVDNHLHRVYAKLGVAGRQELFPSLDGVD